MEKSQIRSQTPRNSRPQNKGSWTTISLGGRASSGGGGRGSGTGTTNSLSDVTNEYVTNEYVTKSLSDVTNSLSDVTNLPIFYQMLPILLAILLFFIRCYHYGLLVAIRIETQF